jgi:hypothetical protein
MRKQARHIIEAAIGNLAIIHAQTVAIGQDTCILDV